MTSFAWRVRRLEELVTDHQRAVAEFIEHATTIPEARWFVPRAAGKWTPAQETRHLVLAYEAFMADMRDGRRAALKGNALKRRLWRLYALPQILWRRRIPVAVHAPREYRPAEECAPRAELLPLFERRSHEFCELFTDKWRAEPTRTLTHPWFGNLNLDHAMRLTTVHTRHHAAFLRQSLP